MAQYCCVIHISDILPGHEHKLTFWAWPQLDIPKRYRKLTFLSMTDTYIHTLRGQIPHSKPRANALGSNSSKLRYTCGDQCVLSDVAQTVYNGLLIPAHTDITRHVSQWQMPSRQLPRQQLLLQPRCFVDKYNKYTCLSHHDSQAFSF